MTIPSRQERLFCVRCRLRYVPIQSANHAKGFDAIGVMLVSRSTLSSMRWGLMSAKIPQCRWYPVLLPGSLSRSSRMRPPLREI